jgi:hypothetical protein
LNSCEAESHRKQDHKGQVSQEQAQAVMDAWLSPEFASWIKVLAVHHNPVVTVPANIADWLEWLKKADQVNDELLIRFASDVFGFEERKYVRSIVEDTGVQLVLHGHHHAKDESSWDWKKKGRAYILSAGSLTLEAGHLPKGEPPSFRLITLDLRNEDVCSHSLIFHSGARAKGVVKEGRFVYDSSESDRHPQKLDLPPDFKLKTGEGESIPVHGDAGPSREFLRVYRRRLGSLFSRWDLASAGVTQAGGVSRPIEATLDHMYLPLRLAPGFEIDETEEGGQITPEDLLVREKPLVIRGSAGAGKTTWMRWTFRRLLESERALPLMMVLRDLARRWQDPTCRDADRSLDAFLSGWVADKCGDEIKECRGELRKVLESEGGPRPILLVDGWDEVGPLGEELRSKLLGLMAEHPRVLVVVTSRPYGEGRPSYSEGFEILDIQPLSDAEIADLASRFFHRCYGEEQFKSEAEAKHLVETLNGAPEAKALARTALLLTMMLLISRSRPLPDKRHLLYEACIENLLNAIPKRRADQGALSLPEQWRPEDSEERLRAVAALAFKLQEVGYKQGRSAIVQAWDAMAALLPESWSPTCRTGFLLWLAGSAGLLTDRVDGTLTFTHLSFQEYLTAWHFNATIEGKEDRITAFQDNLSEIAWWETLRLWGALIERQSPDRLDPVLEALSGSEQGLSLAGTMLADGLGEAPRFQSWIRRLQENLSNTPWSFDIEICARAWAGSQQRERREALVAAIIAVAPHQTWLGWMRHDEFLSKALSRKVPVPHEASLSRILIQQLSGSPAESAASVAAGRVLCGGPPIWPIEPLTAGLLQIWPSHRRLSGIRLQLAANCGAGSSDLVQISDHFLGKPVSGSEQVELAREFAPGFAHELYFFFARNYSGMALDLTRALASDLARYFTCYFPGGFPQDFRRYFAYYFSRYFVRGYGPEFFLSFFHGFVRQFRHDYSRYFSGAFGGFEADDFSWTRDFLIFDLASVGRSIARTVLVMKEGDPKFNLKILSIACRHSFGSEDFTTALLKDPPNLHPLWPALARHIARLSTPEDKALLIDLAQHPEKCEPPLSWGLQYIVRGDVLLEDGSVVTLDQLADEVGLPHLPYLEDMPDELEVDWEAKD